MRSFRFCKTTVVALTLSSALALPAAAGGPNGAGATGWSPLQVWEQLTAWVEAVLRPQAERTEKNGSSGEPQSAGDDCANEACLNYGGHWDPFG
jgi:hypothetical protein